MMKVKYISDTGFAFRYFSGKILLLSFLLLVFAWTAYGQSERKYIRQGNRKFSDGKYPESETAYRKAIDNNKASANAQFNLGDALYKQKKFDEAGKIFTETSGSTLDKKKKADSFYNLGNSMLGSNEFAKAIEAYKNSLRLVPDNEKAKYNLAYAQDLLKKDQQKKDDDKDRKPSEFAKKLKAQADKLVLEGRFTDAFNLMQAGLKKDQSVEYYNDFINKTGKVSDIEKMVK
jgi:Ca-activated chloride channel homolog